MLRKTLAGLGVSVALALVLASITYRRDMKQAYGRLDGRSQIITSPFGDIEYSEGGAGPAVLMVHGSGGGFDQGELLVKAVLDDGFHWIAPSRFGYLRSTFHPGATFDEQADAFEYLLNHLRLDSVAVIALSHGGPSAMLLALRHPERVSSLTLISAGVASSTDPRQASANQQGDALRKIFERDLLYWLITKALRQRFLEIMGASETVIAGLTAEQRHLVDELIDSMNPVSRRSAGAAFDNQATMPNERIAGIRAPTLILHAQDDTLQLYRNAEFGAATIPGARLVRFARGGHLLMAVEQATLRNLVREHILAHEREPG